jgi:hypothetical protein
VHPADGSPTARRGRSAQPRTLAEDQCRGVRAGRQIRDQRRGQGQQRQERGTEDWRDDQDVDGHTVPRVATTSVLLGHAPIRLRTGVLSAAATPMPKATVAGPFFD